MSDLAKNNLPVTLLVLLVGSAVAAVAVSDQSYWIDEMTCKGIASSGSWSGFCESMRFERGSDAQMPVFQLVMFAWDKVCGESERGFRLVNGLFWFVGVAVLAGFMDQRRYGAWGVVMAAATSAFLWYYMDEARPYAMQFAGAACLLGGYWTRVVAGEERDLGSRPWMLMVAGTVLCAGASLLGAPFVGFVFLGVLYDVWVKRVRLGRKDVLWLLVWCAILGVLACYYVWTLVEGKGASAANKTSLASLGFSAFEQLGFMPYGPGRLGLRAGGIPALVPWLGGLVAWLVCVSILMFVGGRRLLQGGLFGGVLARALFPVAGMVAILVVGGYAGGFRVLGRHFMPVYPLLLVVIGLAYTRLWRGGWISRCVCVAIPVVALLGCLGQRYLERHQKDDYRGAVAYVNSLSADGSPVWWAAAVPSYDFDRADGVVFVRNPKGEDLRRMPRPGLVVLSKTDLYDVRGSLREWLAGNGYRVSKELPAFKMYRKSLVE